MLKKDLLLKLQNININLDNYDFSSVPDEFSSKSTISVYCKVHNITIKRLGQNFKNGICKQCSLDARSRTLQQLLDSLDKQYNDYVFHLDDYDLNKPFQIKQKFYITCPNGHKYETMFNRLLVMRNSCAKCVGNVKETIESITEKVEQRFPNKFEYISGEYKYQHSDLIFKCLTCNKNFTTSGNRLLNSVHGCPSCADKYTATVRTKDLNKFIEEVSIVHDYKYDYSKTVYKGAAYKIDIICPKHGLFSMRAGDHLHGKKGCASCGISMSKKQELLTEWLRKQFPHLTVVESYRPDWLKLYGSSYASELDIYIPELNLAIEYNGTYWHSEEVLLKRNRPDFHKTKFDTCKQNGITLIHVFEFENFVKCQKILSNYIRNPEKYFVTFNNEYRTCNNIKVKGKTNIKLKK